MNLNRRVLIEAGLRALLLSATLPALGYSKMRSADRKPVVAFDAFAIFNPAPVAAALETNFPGMGKQLGAAWRARLFDTAWVSALGQHYVDFSQACRQGLRHTLKSFNLPIDDGVEAKLLQSWNTLEVYPDVRTELAQLRGAGIKVGFLSNMTQEMLDANVRANRLEGAFDFIFSTDKVRKYKPDPAAYALVVDTLNVAKDEVVFVPFADWDLAGAKWYGYRTYWANRARTPSDGFGVAADLEAADLTKLAQFVLAHP